MTLSPGLSIAAARDRVASALRAVGLPEAALDARVLVEDAIGLSRSAPVARADDALEEAAASKLNAWVARRIAGEPVFRILGRREFWGLDLAITPDVLDPRPDTETVVEAALHALGSRRSQPLRIADLGVGSGAILSALLSECPAAIGWGTDASLPAARVARRNLIDLGFGRRANVLQGSWATALAPQGVDLVVSNPPYIESAAIAALAREVRDHDPLVALDGGPDGLDCYRTIAADLPRLLALKGIAVLEVGAGQAASVRELCELAGLRHHSTRRDLGGHERAVVMVT